MSKGTSKGDWSVTTFEGSRRDQLLRAQAMTIRQRLEAMDALNQLAARMQVMPKSYPGGSGTSIESVLSERRAGYGAQRAGNEITLGGCTPSPLANYLKALGVLRLLSVRDPQVQGAWRGEGFVLRTILERAEVERFFLESYQPTPVMAPWNGGSGFYDGDNKEASRAIRAGNAPRFAPYRDSLSIADVELEGMDRSASPKNEEKHVLLTRIRGSLSDEALCWFDAAILMSGEEPRYPPLLGTGGNDGRLDFTNNFMQRLLDLMDAETGAPGSESAGWLSAALYGTGETGFVSGSIGQFSPGQAGGPNATVGFGGTSKEANACINPWDFVLMIEGALLFAAAAVRRNAEESLGVLSYPFTVHAVGAGAGNIGGADAATARGELWMPLWEQFVSHAEVKALLSEGRVAIGRKPARDALDFVRAVQQLGNYRGIRSFQRYGLLMRAGKAYLATPLERVEVSVSPQASVLEELVHGDWLARFRRFARGEGAANRVITLCGRLETAFFRLAGKVPTPAEVQAVLVLLGEIEATLNVSKKALEAVPRPLPLPRLSERWVLTADDGAPAFRIARALAGVRDAFDKPHGPAGARLDDVVAYLRDGAMDDRIASLQSGLRLCDIPPDTGRGADDGVAPAAFALLKVCLTPDVVLRKLKILGEEDRLPIPTGMLTQLAAGNAGNRAVRAAWRRLHASGLSPAFDVKALPTLAGLSPRRVAAALQIPLRFGATAAMVRRVLRQDELLPEDA